MHATAEQRQVGEEAGGAGKGQTMTANATFESQGEHRSGWKCGVSGLISCRALPPLLLPEGPFKV